MAAPLSVLRRAALRQLISWKAHSKVTGRLSSGKSSDRDESQSVSPKSTAVSELDLAKPGRAQRMKQANPRDTVQQVQQPDEEGLDKEVVTAVNAVANAASKSSQTLRSDLLKKLQEQRTKTHDAEKKEDKFNVRSLLAGMKLEKTSVSMDTAMSRRQNMEQTRQRDTERIRPERRVQNSQNTGGLRLFEGPAMGIFKQSSAVSTEVEGKKSLFDIIEDEEREKLTVMPPNNAFEEMIRWTKEGKLWKFPIDNEQGMDDEARVGFHEHIFLEQYLNDFPQKGPIRHFMELVVVGLSKNPYLTAQEKREHIAWYAEYFKDKYHLIDENFSVPSDSVKQVDAGKA